MDARAPRLRYRDIINRPGDDGSLSRIETLEQSTADALARITEEAEVWVTDIEAGAQRTTELEARFGNASSEIAVIAQTIARADATFARYQIELSSQIGDLDGDITANANAILALDTRVTDNEGDITAQAAAILALEASVGDLEATATLFLDAFVDSGTGEVISRFGFNLTAYGVVTSMEAIAQNGPTGPISEIVFGDTTSLRSEDYVADTSGWLIDNVNGLAEFNDVKVRGTLYSDKTAVFLVQKNAAQAITGNGARVKVTWQTEVSDVDGRFSTANSRFTAEVKGVYMFVLNLRVYVDSGAPTSISRIIEIRKNGSDTLLTNLLQETDELGANDIYMPFALSLEASDYIEIFYEVNDTGSATYEIDSGQSSQWSGVLLQRID